MTPPTSTSTRTGPLRPPSLDPDATRGAAPGGRSVLDVAKPAAWLALRTTALGLIAIELVVLVLWATEANSGSGAGATLRTGLAIWLAAHHTGLRLAHGHLGVTPYLLTAFPAVLLWRGAAAIVGSGVAGRDDGGPRPLLRTVGALAPAYAVVTLVVALLAAQPALTPAPRQAFLGGLVVALVAGGGGAWRASRYRPALPGWLRAGLRGALVAGLVVGTVAALAVAFGLVVHQGAVRQTSHAVAPGASGAVGLFLLDLLGVPLAVLDAVALVVGPGFGIGAHTSVSLAGVTLGPTPGLPLLGALPGSGGWPWSAWLLLAVPVAAGALGALRVTRDVGPDTGELLRRCGVVAAAVGLGAVVLALLADGPVGPGRLAVAGPSPWKVGLLALAEVGGGALLVAAGRTWRARQAD